MARGGTSSFTRILFLLAVIGGVWAWQTYFAGKTAIDPREIGKGLGLPDELTGNKLKRERAPRDKSSGKKSGDTPRGESLTSSGTAVYLNHTELGLPVSKVSGDDLIAHAEYVAGYNKSLNVPNWVAWNLNETHFGDAERSNDFQPDPLLPRSFTRITTKDFSGSGYDRGHLVRSEERTASDTDNRATFYLTNILPQYHDLNAGPWLRLEEHCQKLAQQNRRELYIIAGGIFSSAPERLKGKVAVPVSTYKIIVVLERGQGLKNVTAATPVIAVNMPNVKGIIRNDWESYRTTVAEIERQSGYTYFSALPFGVGQALKNKSN